MGNCKGRNRLELCIDFVSLDALYTYFTSSGKYSSCTLHWKARLTVAVEHRLGRTSFSDKGAGDKPVTPNTQTKQIPRE